MLKGAEMGRVFPTFEECRRLYVDEGKTISDICRAYGYDPKCNASRVSRLLRENGIEIRRYGLTQKAQNGDEEAKELPPINKGGRPPGAKNKPKPNETQKMGVTKKGDNAKILKHSLAMLDWAPPDMQNAAEVAERVLQYFNHCVKQDMTPTMAGLALSLGTDRFHIQKWASGAGGISAESAAIIHRAVCILDADSAQKLVRGMTHPKAGEFIMKNTLGYKDETTLIQEHAETRPTLEQIQAKYRALLSD